MMQMVELHFRRSPTYHYVAVKARAEEILQSEIDCPEPAAAGKAVLMFHKGHSFRYKEGEMPAQTAILTAGQQSSLEAYRQDIQQSWRWPNAEELLRECVETRLVTEMMARFLSPHDRVSLFHGVLRAMIEVANPDALVFKHSQQIVRPQAYLAACDQDPILRPGSLNVRFFNISNSEGDMLMDTGGSRRLGSTICNATFAGWTHSRLRAFCSTRAPTSSRRDPSSNRAKPSQESNRGQSGVASSRARCSSRRVRFWT